MNLDKDPEKIYKEIIKNTTHVDSEGNLVSMAIRYDNLIDICEKYELTPIHINEWSNKWEEKLEWLEEQNFYFVLLDMAVNSWINDQFVRYDCILNSSDAVLYQLMWEE